MLNYIAYTFLLFTIKGKFMVAQDHTLPPVYSLAIQTFR